MANNDHIQDYNLSNLLKKEHGGKWVAISSDYKKVVDFSDDLVQLEKKVGSKDVVYIKALQENVTYAF